MRNNVIISLKEVETLLLNDAVCTKDRREEVLSTLSEIDSKEGRRWIFTDDKKRYYIDEYNQYNDFVKTYTFKNEQ
jgi:hypothetical protein